MRGGDSSVRPSSTRPAAPADARPRFADARVRVEGEHRDVDLDHHRAQQRPRLERPEPLIVQRLRQHVDLEHHRTERIVAAGAARADRKIAFAQRRQQVGQRLQRQHDAMPHAEGTAAPDADDEDGQRPLDFGGVIAGPQQDQRDERGREAGGQRKQQDALSASAGTVRKRPRYYRP